MHALARLTPHLDYFISNSNSAIKFLTFLEHAFESMGSLPCCFITAHYCALVLFYLCLEDFLIDTIRPFDTLTLS